MKKYVEISVDPFNDPSSEKEQLDSLLKLGFECLKRIEKHKKVLLKMPDKKKKVFFDTLYKLTILNHLPII
jgi:hypothetical protein